MANDKTQTPPHIKAGQLFRSIERLPGEQRILVLGQSQAERERIMALTGGARDAAIDALKPGASTAAQANEVDTVQSNAVKKEK